MTRNHQALSAGTRTEKAGGQESPGGCECRKQQGAPECPPVGGRLNILEVSTAEGYGTHVRNEADGDMCGPASDTRICFSCNSSVHTQTTGVGGVD